MNEPIAIAALNQYAYFLCGGCHPKIERIGSEQVRDDTIFFA